MLGTGLAGFYFFRSQGRKGRLNAKNVTSAKGSQNLGKIWLNKGEIC